MTGKWDTSIDLSWLSPKILEGGGTSEPLETEGQEQETEDKETAVDSLASEHVVSSSTNTANNNHQNNTNNNLFVIDPCTLDNYLFISCTSSSSRSSSNNLDADDATKRSGVG